MVKVVKREGETKRDAIDRMISELTAQKKSILAEDKGKARKQEDRKKILIGSFFVAHPDRLDALLKDPAFEKHFTRNIDREVFGFAPLPSEKKDKEVKTEKEKTSHKGEKQEHKAEHKASKSEPKKDGTFTIPDDEIWTEEKIKEKKIDGTFVVEPDIEDL